MQEFKTHSGLLRIDLGALADNYQLFGSKTDQNTTAAGVVKANAYGLGLKQVCKTLKSQGCTQFFVATLEEALVFREFDQISNIAVLGGLFTGAEDVYIAHNITPVLNSPDDIQRWQQCALNKGQDNNIKLPALLHYDTGMNRLGLNQGEAYDLLDNPELLEGIDVQLVMSHFISADDWNEDTNDGRAAKDVTAQQVDQFNDFKHKFQSIFKSTLPHVRFSLANSSGLFRDKAFHYDLVRPGYALYGGNPTPEFANPMQAVVTLNARILQVRDCEKGDTIGYGSSYQFDAPTRTATIGLGYADGFLRSNSNSGVVYYNNQPCPIIGRVSMDLVTIDISKIQGQQPQQGNAIEIIGSNQTIDSLAKSADTIGYEILTSLGTRYKRLYTQ